MAREWKNKQIEPIESFRDTATILQTMPLFLITLHRCLLTRCLSSQHVCSRRTGTARRAREPALTQSFQFTAQSFTQTFTGVHRHRVLTENKDHTQIRTLPRVDGLTQQENVNSSANWKSWGGLDLFGMLSFDHRADPEDTRGIWEQEDNAGGEGYVGLSLLVAPQPWPS